MDTVLRHPALRLSLVALVIVMTAMRDDVRGQIEAIPAETEVVIRTVDPIDTGEATAERAYAAVLDEPVVVGTTVAAPKGTDAVLQVAEASNARGVSGRASLTLRLVALMISGQRVPVTTAGVKSEGGSQAGRATKAGIGGAAVGAIVGGLLGGKSGAATGAAVGGGAAVGVVAVTGQRIQVPAETRLTFVLTAAAPLGQR